MIINPYRFAAGATGLLTDYPGAAAAFSLRELSSDWAGQDVIEVRRSSDDTADTFTSAQITDGTLTTFTGAGGGFIRTWYDQSGNGFDVTQTTLADQPQIVGGGILLTVGGLPTIVFDGANHYLSNTTGGTTTNGNIDYNGGVSWYAVVDSNLNAATARLWSDDITGAQGYVIFATGTQYQLNDNDTGLEAITFSGQSNFQELRSFHFDSSTGNYEYAFDGSNTTGNMASWSDVAIDSSNTANVGVGGSGNGNQLFLGSMQELIIYPDDQSGNRTGIEGDINTHYLIY